MDPVPSESSDPDLALLNQFLKFRLDSITSFVFTAAEMIHSRGLEVGLDTFSPTLARLVGQDLQTLNDCCEWIKVMSYGHGCDSDGAELVRFGRLITLRVG